MSKMSELDASIPDGYRLVRQPTIHDAINSSPGTMHLHATIIAACISDGGELDEVGTHNLKAVIAICKAALEGRALRGADVYNATLKEIT